MSKEKLDFNSPRSLIAEAGMKIYALRLFSNQYKIEDLRKKIVEVNLQNLEESSGLSREVIEKYRPGICDQFNKLIEDLKDPNLTVERFKEIIEQISKIIHEGNEPWSFKI